MHMIVYTRLCNHGTKMVCLFCDGQAGVIIVQNKVKSISPKESGPNAYECAGKEGLRDRSLRDTCGWE